ncbi:NAD(P)H-dependent oxidoreductase [Roseovarius sp. CAU 1744]|uniref:FMN-dependent NADH-azoreductase n=1 Tax=Roseovarius sp. CAU 1744 TaxID=3140368 RepID=UPI00325A79EF
MSHTVLHVDASARLNGSTTRQLTAQIVEKLGGKVIHRDLADALPQIDETWVNANLTPADKRTGTQQQALALSDALIAEIKAADTLVIGVPLYNFSVPTALKAWIDQIGRAGVTFRYTETGPEGLMEGKRAILAVATGGTSVGSDIDFATQYMRHFLGFIGITDVEIVAADRQLVDAEQALSGALAQIDALAA